MLGQLVVIAGPDQGKVFPIRDGQTLVLGRGLASDTLINDPHMSAFRHPSNFRAN